MLSILRNASSHIAIAGIAIMFLSLGSSTLWGETLYPTHLIDSLKDSDLDGVIDARDECDKTPRGVDVDNDGCPLTNITYFSFTLDVQFDTSRYRLNSEFLPNLGDIATFLHQAPDTIILIEGHTDNTGSPAYNLVLSERRAESIASALINHFNIDSSRIKTLGYGQAYPIASNNTEMGRQQNRRVNGTIVIPLGFNQDRLSETSLENNKELMIPFLRNHYGIQDKDNAIIRYLADTLVQYPDSMVILEGHTDNTGNKTYNQALSLKRATQVANLLKDRSGISEKRLKILGYGETHPIATNFSTEGREKNRRVNAMLVKPFKASQEELKPRWTIWSVDNLNDKIQEPQ